MRKLDLITQLTNDTNLSKIDAIIFLDTFIKVVEASLERGENVHLRGFGSFIVKKRNAKKGRDIQNDTLIDIPAHYIPSFKASQEFTQKLKPLTDDNVTKYARKNSK
jgi:DNA-binding protein HU-beta